MFVRLAASCSVLVFRPLGQRGARLCATLCLLNGVIACQKHSDGHQHGQEASGESHAGHTLGSSTQLSLNDGKKWQANAETTQGVAQMRSIVTTALEKGATQSTAQNLQAVFNNIFLQCTMTGEAHEQLHSFLIPLGPEFKKLEASSPEQTQAKLQEIQTHLATYDDYFQ